MTSPHSILITGANRGLGLGLVRCFLRENWLVIGSFRQESAASELLSLCDEYPGRLFAFACDVSDDESVRRFHHEVGQQLSALDVLVNNAGLLIKGESNFEIPTSASIQQSLNVNTVGSFRICQSFLPLLRKGRRKCIVHISSIMGSIAATERGGSLSYRIAKAGVNMLSRSLAAELATEGIISLALHPGWVQTEMGGPNATLSIEDSADGIARVIMNAKLETHSGRFFDWRGEALEY